VRGGTYDPYPSLSVTTASLESQSPLEPGSNVGRRRKKWKFDNAKWAGQKRAIERLELEPKTISMPRLETTKDE
jgi:hypothetical protein